MSVLESDEVRVVDQNWFQREGNACGSMCLGFCLVPICVIGIFYNELNYVKELATADLIKKATIVPNCQTGSSGNNAFVYVTGCKLQAPNLAPGAPDVLQQFMPERFEGAELAWSVEIKQWKRHCRTESTTHKTSTGGSRTVQREICECKLDWFPNPIPSECQSEQNLGASMPSNIQNGVKYAPKGEIKLFDPADPNGESFVLSQTFTEQIPYKTGILKAPYSGQPHQFWNGGRLDAGMLNLHSDGVLKTGDDLNDIRVTVTGRGTDELQAVAADEVREGKDFTFVAHPPEQYSIFGRETNPVAALVDGSPSRSDYISDLKVAAGVMTMIVRIILFIVMIAAFNCIFQPLSVMADLLKILNFCTCCLGDILDNAAQMVIGMVSCGCGCSCFLVAFILAWMYANPFYAILGLVVLFGLVGAAFFLKSQVKGKKVFAREPADYSNLDEC